MSNARELMEKARRKPVSADIGAKHELQRIRGGMKEMGWIQPSCSCGWIGRKEYAYEDYQHTNVAEQEQEHQQSWRVKGGA